MRMSYDARPEAAVDCTGFPENAMETTENGRGTTVPVTIEEWAASLCSRALQLSLMRWIPAASRPCCTGAGTAGAGAGAAGAGSGASGLALVVGAGTGA